MARHEQGVEYFEETIRGRTVKTLNARLYAPDGSIFKMPQGGNVTTYVSKGYSLKPTDEWKKKNDIYEQQKADSLELSNFKRELKNQEVENKMREERVAAKAAMLEMKAKMDAESHRIASAENSLGDKLSEEEKIKPKMDDEDNINPPKRKPGRPAKAKA